jgi:hypothetical protein
VQLQSSELGADRFAFAFGQVFDLPGEMFHVYVREATEAHELGSAGGPFYEVGSYRDLVATPMA